MWSRSYHPIRSRVGSVETPDIPLSGAGGVPDLHTVSLRDSLPLAECLGSLGLLHVNQRHSVQVAD